MPRTLVASEGSPGEVFRAFLRLGLTSFGGPVAHLGYFRDELVLRRGWTDEGSYAELVALCQFLPGPASSQVGFALGVARGGGVLGGLAAWCGFTLPSAVVMVAFALGADALTGPAAEGALHGLKLAAVAVVAQAVWGMARTLAPDRIRAGLAFAALASASVTPGTWGQLPAIALGALAGWRLCRGPAAPTGPGWRVPVSRRQGAAALAAFAVLLLALPVLARQSRHWALAAFDAFYRAGALVFGGGHVVLPLLQAEVAGLGGIPEATFLTGYAAAQALPGPLFTFAAYLGAVVEGPSPLAGAALALVAVFMPGLLLVYGALPFWDGLRARPAASAAMRGANAAVVGVLGAALYSPVWTTAVLGQLDMVIAVGGWLLLTIGRAQSWLVVGMLASLAAALRVAGLG